MRKNRPSRWQALLLTLVFCALPIAEAKAVESSDVLRPLEVGFDLVILRPVRAFNLLVGGLILGPSLLMSLPNGTSTRDEAIELYWTIPLESLTERELGDL